MPPLSVPMTKALRSGQVRWLAPAWVDPGVLFEGGSRLHFGGVSSPPCPTRVTFYHFAPPAQGENSPMRNFFRASHNSRNVLSRWTEDEAKAARRSRGLHPTQRGMEGRASHAGECAYRARGRRDATAKGACGRVAQRKLDRAAPDGRVRSGECAASHRETVRASPNTGRLGLRAKARSSSRRVPVLARFVVAVSAGESARGGLLEIAQLQDFESADLLRARLGRRPGLRLRSGRARSPQRAIASEASAR